MRPDSPDVQILRRLLAAGDAFCSGEELAAQLSLSRVAVWKRLEKLKHRGFAIEAVRRKGYRLTGLPPHSTDVGILSHLPEDAGLATLTLLETSPSTNNEVLQSLATGTPVPLACLTRRQPAGKGRRGRSWAGDFPGNLYGSIGFRPNLPPGRLSLLTLWAGLRICRRIATLTGLPVQLKWPNDLVLGGRKLAGILAESTLETDRITALVIGIGMNINMTEKDFPAELRSLATSLRIESGKSFPLDSLIAHVLSEILGAMRDCEAGIDEDRLSDEWEARACYLGQPVFILDSEGGKTEGTLAGIDRSGALLLRTTGGSLQSFRAGDVSLRSQSSAT